MPIKFIAFSVFFSFLVSASCLAADTVDLIVGTYNQKGSEGIYQVTYSPKANMFNTAKLLVRADNPSYLINQPKYVYAVNEVSPGRISAFKKIDGILKLEKMTDVNGPSPCHLSFGPGKNRLAVANYMGGNVAVFDMAASHTKGQATMYKHQGKGAHSRQEAPHAHWVGWHPKKPWLYVVDLGIDEVRFYNTAADDKSGKTALKLQPGDGPRHMAFHPKKPVVYVLNELSNTLVTASISKDGVFTEQARLSTLPSNFEGSNLAAHIQVSSGGEHLYVSNRGHNSIAVFELNKDGEAKLVQHQDSGGDGPRHFSVIEAEALAFVANQKSHNVVAFKVLDSGQLKPLGAEVEVAQPTFVGKI